MKTKEAHTHNAPGMSTCIYRRVCMYNACLLGWGIVFVILLLWRLLPTSRFKEFVNRVMF